MRSRFIKDEIAYTGEQLRSLFAFDTFGIVGDSIVAFIGPCNVSLKEMVDLEDLKAGRKFSSERMLHFIVEHFDIDLEKAILRQYLLVNIIKDLLNEKTGSPTVKRVDTDLADNDGKLTISSATASPVSTLAHVGINILGAEAGKTKGLETYKVDPTPFASEVLERYTKEVEKIIQTRCRVRWVE